MFPNGDWREGSETLATQANFKVCKAKSEGQQWWNYISVKNYKRYWEE